MVWLALKKVFRKWTYVILAVGVSMIAFVFAMWLPNLGLVISELLGGGSISERTGLPIALLGSLSTSFTVFSGTYTVAIVLLLGVSVSMIGYAMMNRVKTLEQVSLASIFGTFSGALGIGCAACGSVLLTPVLAALGGTALVTILPLRGGEFGLLGVALLMFSIYATAREIQTPIACKIS